MDYFHVYFKGESSGGKYAGNPVCFRCWRLSAASHRVSRFPCACSYPRYGLIDIEILYIEERYRGNVLHIFSLLNTRPFENYTHTHTYRALQSSFVRSFPIFFPL